MMGMLQRLRSTKTHPSSVYVVLIFINFQVSKIMVLKLTTYFFTEEFHYELVIIYPTLLLLVKLLLKYLKHTSVNFALS